jgi:exportin-1
VFSLCVEVLEKADKASLIKATLEAMLRFLNWIPLGYIFETPVIDHLITRVCCRLQLFPSLLTSSHQQFLEVPEFRNVTLKCLSEIGGLQIGAEYNSKFIILFNSESPLSPSRMTRHSLRLCTVVMTSVNKMVPPSTGSFSLAMRVRGT